MFRSLSCRICVILSVLLAFVSSGIVPAYGQIEDETQDAVQAGLAAAGERAQEEIARREEAAKKPAPEADEEVAADEEAGTTLEVRPEIVDKAMASYTFSLKQIAKKAEKNMARVQKEIARQKKDEESAAEPAEKKTVSPKKQVARKHVMRARPRPAATKPPRKKCEVQPKPRTRPPYVPRPVRRQLPDGRRDGRCGGSL